MASFAKFTFDLVTSRIQDLEATVASGPLFMIHEPRKIVALNLLSDWCRFVLCFAPLRQLKEILD